MYTDADRTTAVDDEAKRLETFLRALSPADWQRPSRCDQWQVADVVAHLTAGQHATRIARGLQGELGPPVGGAPTGTLSENAFRERLAQSAIALRSELGDQLLSVFCSDHEQVAEILTGLKPEDWDTPCYHPMGPEPVRTIIDVRLTEMAMHGWDIRASFNPQAVLSEAALPALLLTVPRAVRRAFRPDVTRVRAVRYRWQMTGPVSATTDILLNADGPSVISDSRAEADISLHGKTSTAMLVIFGRLSLADAIAAGEVHVEGEQELVSAFEQDFQGG